jgi:hypothetical protein
MAGGRQGFVLSQRPKKYQTLPQQEKLKQACEACGIRKGMKREELVKAMKECIPQQFAKMKGETKQ